MGRTWAVAAQLGFGAAFGALGAELLAERASPLRAVLPFAVAAWALGAFCLHAAARLVLLGRRATPLHQRREVGHYLLVLCVLLALALAALWLGELRSERGVSALVWALFGWGLTFGLHLGPSHFFSDQALGDVLGQSLKLRALSAVTVEPAGRERVRLRAEAGGRVALEATFTRKNLAALEAALEAAGVPRRGPRDGGR